jgi:hypothetical protein
MVVGLVDTWANVLANGWTDKCTLGWAKGWTVEWMYERMDR